MYASGLFLSFYVCFVLIITREWPT